MPNWCSNTLQVRIPPELADKFLEAVGGRQYDHNPVEVLCAHKIIPYPKEYMDRDRICHNILGKEHGFVVECPKCGPMNSTKAPYSKADKKHHCATCGSICTDFKDGFNSGGYEWCAQHWGTKWGFCEPRLVQRSYQLVGKKNITQLSFEFDTAWRPPSPLIAAMATQWPQATFHMCYKLEEGGGGTEEYAVGERRQRTMHETDEEDGDLVPMQRLGCWIRRGYRLVTRPHIIKL